MDVDAMVTGVRDAMKAQLVYGEPIERNGTLVVPAAKIRGGGGGGGGADGETNGSGGGFGITAKPAGAWVIRGDEVSWQPALDLNRVILGGQIVAIVAFLALRAIFGRR
jgi:uncharacterized spore protein YtfJ